MLSCVWASCLEETSHTTETHAKQNPWLALWCGHHAFASLHSVGPVPTFYKCPIWHELCPAVSLKVLVQIPSSNVNLIQILNDPNYAFQIVSSHIVFRENPRIMFYQLDWQQMEKNWKVVCTASFYFIVTHYSRLCALISASSCLATRGGKVGRCSASAFVFLVFSSEVCQPRIAATRAITAECPLFHQHFNAKIWDPTPSQ